MQGMMIMPPHPDVCQTCARDHEPHMPHDQQSIYYQMAFNIQNKRFPTWHDAMAHCTDEVKELWTEALRNHGIEIGPPPQEKTEEDEDK